MKILALELSTSRGGVALIDNDAEKFTPEFPNDRKNSADFFRALADMHTLATNVDRVVVGLGPGSYAGVRIAISAAIGLQIAIGGELIGLPSICAIETDADEFCVVGDARRHSFFFARIDAGECAEGPMLLSEADLRGRITATQLPIYASEPLPRFDNVEIAFPSAKRLGRLVQREHANKTLPPLQPIYLREPHITISKQPVWNARS